MEVLLDDASGLGTIQSFVRNASLHESPSDGLETRHDGADELVTFLFQVGEDTSPEEYLRPTNTIPSPIHAKLLQHHAGGTLSLQISFRYILTKDFVPLSEFRKVQTIGESS